MFCYRARILATIILTGLATPLVEGQPNFSHASLPMAFVHPGLLHSSAALKRIADTGAPLYQSLNDAQKNRFSKLARILRPHHHMHAHNEGNGGGWHEERSD